MRNIFTTAITFYRSNVRKTALILYILFWVATLAAPVVVRVTGLDNTIIQMEQAESDETDAAGTTTSESFDVRIANIAETLTGSQSSWLFYLLLNGRGCLTLIVLGIIPFIPCSLLLCLYQFVTGAMGFSVTSQMFGISSYRFILFALAPHGIFEIAALSIAAATGLYICRTLTRKILRKESDSVKEMLVHALCVYLCIVLPLVLVAGIIEGHVSPLLTRTFIG